jgi:hypothetical protein
MVSASEAFSKFSIWKNDRTSLRVTVIERDQPEDVFSGRIDTFDPDALLIGICVGVKQYGTFDVTGATFSVEPDRVVVERDDLEWLIFEKED